MRSPIPSFLIRFLAVVATVAPTRSQCGALFQPGDPAGAPRGQILATQLFDPDGSGPLPLELVIGGELDDGNVSPVFAYDGTRWHTLGTPPPGRCTALGLFNGELIAAIDHPISIAAWNGTTWRVFGTASGFVSSMAVFNGRLVLGGNFSSFNGVTAASVIQWDGTAWSALGSGITGGGATDNVHAMAVYAGALWVGGGFTHAGGLPARNLATWNGSAWSAPASVDGSIQAMVVHNSTSATNSFLFIGGSFNQVGTLSAPRVARFNQLNGWVALPGFPFGGCRSLVTRATGLTFELVAALDPSGGAVSHAIPLVWNGSGWVEIGTGRPDSYKLTLFGGRYVALGLLGTVRTLDAARNWVGLGGPGIDGPVLAVAATATDVVIGGSFSSISGVIMNGVARGRVGAWQPLGSGVLGGSVNATAVMPNGDIVAAGAFEFAGSQPAVRIARWNGTVWSPLGPGLGSPTSGYREEVLALAVLADGSLVAGGRFQNAGNLLVNNIARWDGASWTAMGNGFPDIGGPSLPQVLSLALRPDGELLAGGNLPAPGVALRSLARWNGSAWLPMPAEVNGQVTSLATLANGDVLVGGRFDSFGSVPSAHLARWTGSALIAVPGFTVLPANYVPTALVALPDGSALVSGRVTNAANPSNPRFARFDGQAVSALPDPSATFSNGLRTSNGDVFFVGDFFRPGNVLSAHVTRYVSPCPVFADRYGTGCTGSGGLGDLRAIRLPVVGGTFIARATGMPAIGLTFAVTGFAPTSIPLQSLLPQGLPGCNLLTTADAVELRPMANGSAQSSLPVPASMPLVGMVLHHQFVAFELGPLVNLVAATSTNGLRLQLGVF